MIKSTSPARENKIPICRMSRLAELAGMAGTWLFARDDRAALAHGWQITERHAGLGRRYRDPRFDTLLRCRDCGGDGARDGDPCQHCRGTGRVTRQRSPAWGERT